MKHDWTDATKKRWSRLFVYAISHSEVDEWTGDEC